ncbi:hypothetical protein [Bifidobacterium sp. SO1]|uniref:hypothetical protein n=1 Tax=Bifidobacterium sp. SO1 TaxID=2809029 RepID=UPI001BDD438E|nr:hypothetical protein [Bifidobacterium sp. SO1]MBT1161738.1 hypothetical protein [Bifidobacterium sp. SO1]
MVIDVNGMSHKPKGLPARVAGNYDGKADATTDADIRMPLFDESRRMSTLLEDRLPLDPDRTLKAPTLDETDDAEDIRRKLARYLYKGLSRQTDLESLADRNVKAVWPDATPYVGGRPEADRHLRYLTEKNGCEFRAWAADDGKRVIFVSLGAPKASLNRVGYLFRDTGLGADTTTLGDLMAANVILDRMGDGKDHKTLGERILKGDSTLSAVFRPLGWNMFRAACDDLHLDLPDCPDSREDAITWANDALRRLDGLDGANYSKVMLTRQITHYRRWLDVLPEAGEFRAAADDIFGTERNVMANRMWKHRLEHSKSATVWQDKRNPDPKHVEAGRRSTFAEDFTRIEVDDDVDLARFADLSQEWGKYRNLLPSQKEEATLRFRYTGRHHAYGTYHPHALNIAVDPRHPDSFTHEYFHHLDHTLGERDLSLDPEFKPIIDRYQATVDQSQMSGNADHWMAPTEILARCAETWMSRHGGDGSSLLKTREDYATRWEYAPFQGMEDEIDRVMGRLFS